MRLAGLHSPYCLIQSVIGIRCSRVTVFARATLLPANEVRALHCSSNVDASSAVDLQGVGLQIDFGERKDWPLRGGVNKKEPQRKLQGNCQSRK